ncbi:hypothetical protein HKX48_002367 [Thoreauomyces humboldtii]|nr:hypothetical protein HKX48_002367 [Thoreauomyces humboldtii]
MAPNSQLDRWAADKLAEQMGLGGEELKQIVEFLLSIQTPEEVVEFLSGMLGTDSAAVTFIEEFNTKRFPKMTTSGAWTAPLKTAVPEPVAPEGYRKAPLNDHAPGNNQNAARGEDAGLLISDRLESSPSGTRAANAIGKKKKGKAGGRMNVDAANSALEDIDGMVKVGNAPAGFGGRVACECLAAVHGLVTNCLHCGRIVCRLEGEGPCATCGTPVHSARQQITLVQTRKREAAAKPKPKDGYVGSRYGRAAGAQIPLASASAAAAASATVDSTLFPTLMSEADRAALNKAEAQRERLLDYQRNSTARTRVHDQASDFSYEDDAANKWLSAEDRALALRKAQEERKWAEDQKRRRVISIDLVNKRVTSAVEQNPFAKAGTPGTRVEPVSEEAPIDAGSTGQFRNPTIRIAPIYTPPTPVGTTKQTSKAASTETPSVARIPIQRRKAAAALAEIGQNVPVAPATPPPKGKTQKKGKTQLRRLQHDLAGFEGLYEEEGGDRRDGGEEAEDEPARG